MQISRLNMKTYYRNFSGRVNDLVRYLSLSNDKAELLLPRYNKSVCLRMKFVLRILGREIEIWLHAYLSMDHFV